MVGLAAACVCGTAQATVLWYDGFSPVDYTAGIPLGGQSGGSGPPPGFFYDPWENAGYPEDAQYHAEVSATGLSRPGVSSTGGSVANKPNSACQHGYGGCTENRTSRKMTEPWSAFTDPDGTFYVSFLADFKEDGQDVGYNPHHRVFEMHLSGLDDSQRQLMMGISSFVGEFGGSTRLSLAAHDSSILGNVWETDQFDVGGIAPTLRHLGVQDTHLLVMKFEMSTTGSDVISAWLDPVGSIEPLPDAQIVVGQFLADRMSTIVNFVYDFGGAGSFDELRVGTEFGDVATNTLPFAIPEPGSMTLILSGMFGMFVLRRNRG